MKFAHIDTANQTVIKKLREHPRADGGPVVGLIPGTAIVPIVTEDQPQYDPRQARLDRTETVTGDAITIGWVATAHDEATLIENIKAAAQQVIEGEYPTHKQLNTLTEKAQGSGGNADFAKMRNWIRAVRAESDAKESSVSAGDPVDFDDWPAP